MAKQIKLKETDVYLTIPIQTQKEKRTMVLSLDGEKFTELQIPIGILEEAEYSYDYLAHIPIVQYRGNVLLIEGDFPDAFYKGITTSKVWLKSGEKEQRIHFTTEYGWMNDPNGLVYTNGQYHLYFQYNPFDTQWDNMSWGHGVSSDLLHWEQKDLVLLPNKDGMIFSGCGLENQFGLLNLPKDTLLFFYSAAGGTNGISKGKEFVQKIAYSKDEGNTLIKLDKGIIPSMGKENRDPKVFWHEETKAYIMCLWLEESDFAILRSADLEHWDVSQKLTLDKGFECPDLFELYTDKGKSKWVFWCADGYYFWGDFDGYRFKTDGVRQEAYKTKLPYAAQTISNIKNKTISIPWLRIINNGKNYTGAMGIPRELSLVEQEGNYFLKQSPISTLKQNQKPFFSAKPEIIKSGKISVELPQDNVIIIETTLLNIRNSKTAGITRWIMGDLKIVYQTFTGILRINGEELEIGQNIQDFTIILDGRILEISAKNDIIYAVFDLVNQIEMTDITVLSDHLGTVEIFGMK